ncbi:MAG: carbohydrate ABC transporter substrate-binding protein [Opitutales bacterium]|nr:carbohydrate ABC transporter substrate-binding protein [Opitutales bacterium]
MKRSLLNLLGMIGALPASLLALCVVSMLCTALVIARDKQEHKGLVYWSFAREHLRAYVQQTESWNKQNPDLPVHLTYVSEQALTDRMMGSFFAGTPSADMIEMNQGPNVNVWRGPDEATGFRDLAPLLRRDGLIDKINPPSLSPWTRQGRIYGLPHDVHPVLLCYRADIVEAAGINVDELTTWDKFFEALAPLCGDLDGDGYSDRHVLEMPETTHFMLVIMVDQAGGMLIDDYDRVHMNSPAVANVLAKLASWAAREDKLTADIPVFTAAAAQPLLKGQALSWLCPDWRVANMYDMAPGLAGKVKLMPLPAWEEGGRRTSVLGGTMLGLPKVTRGGAETAEAAWQFARNLYFSKETAEYLFRETGIITPIKDYWTLPVFDEKSDFFCGQRFGRMYIEQAPNVPIRSSSPYLHQCCEELLSAYTRLISYAQEHDARDMESLQSEAARLLDIAAKNVQLAVDRGTFEEGEK